MTRRTLASLGIMVREQRGSRKLREVAKEVGIGAATLMRVESGRVPDLKTFGKLCKWLGEDPGTFLGFQPRSSKDAGREETPLAPLLASAHLKADKAPQAETVKALAKMILFAAQRQRGTMEKDLDGDV